MINTCVSQAVADENQNPNQQMQQEPEPPGESVKREPNVIGNQAEVDE